MSVLPVSPGRTSELLTTQRLVLQTQRNQSDLQSLYNQLSTGRRVLFASDDPAAATRATLLKRSLQYTQQLTRNAEASDRLLSATDGLLSDVATTIIDARAAANEGAQSVISTDERQTLVKAMDEQIRQLLSAGNRTYEGHYLMSGGPSALPLEFKDGYVRWTGNQSVLSSYLETGRSSPTSSTIIDAFGLDGNAQVSTTDLRPSITANTNLADLRNGEGVQLSQLRIFDSGAGNWKTVDFTGIQTVGQLDTKVASIQVDGRPLATQIQNGRIQLKFADGLPGYLPVDEVPGGTTAAQLGWANASGAAAPPLGSRNLQPALNEHTKLSEAANGTGLNLAAGIKIRQGDDVYTIDFNGAQTMGDVLVAINRSDADVAATLDPATGHIKLQSLRSGVDFGVLENGGTAAQQLGIRTATTQTKLQELLYGQGIQTLATGADFKITRADGVELGVDIDGLSSVQDVINAINSHVANTSPGAITASLSTTSNGIVLQSSAGAGQIKVAAISGSNAAQALGFVAKGATESTGTTSGASAQLTGADLNMQAPGGMVDNLLRMRDAIRDSDFPEIGRLQALMDLDSDKFAGVRAEIGMQSQATSDIQARLEDDAVRLEAGVSDNIDADITSVVSQVALRQAALEASLRLMGQTAQMTVLNFL